MEYFKLNNNLLIPKVGIGTNTFGKVNHEYMGEINFNTNELISAFSHGYRLIDTAISYRNEAVIGKAIKESNLKREDFFITSKIGTKIEYVKDLKTIKDYLNKSINNIGSYVDLYLIHHPSTDDLNLKLWEILESYYEKGLFKAIGVSNFTQEQIDYLIEHSKIIPAVNQIEINSNKFDFNLINYLIKNNIYPTAWSPLHLNKDSKDFLTKVGEKYNKTWAQVYLRFLTQLNIIVIPKSHHEKRQLENISIFDFSLNDEEINVIKQHFI
ncbi:MAG: aldo/keto reductase [Acholeplasmataceae bacterium]